MGVRLWVPKGQAKQTSRVAVKGYTDNQSNESLLKKFITSKFPSTLILMELAEELTAKRCELKLQWLRRDANQLADDFMNENFNAFDMDLQISLKGEDMKWRILDKLMAGGRGRKLPSRAKAQEGRQEGKARFQA